MKILIVGAGPTGALISYLLRNVVKNKVPLQSTVTIWEKSRGCGMPMRCCYFVLFDFPRYESHLYYVFGITVMLNVDLTGSIEFCKEEKIL